MDKKETTKNVVRSPSALQGERAKPKDTLPISSEQQDELLADMEATAGTMDEHEADDDVELEIVVDAELSEVTNEADTHRDPDKR
jgi:hypothetical protein